VKRQPALNLWHLEIEETEFLEHFNPPAKHPAEAKSIGGFCWGFQGRHVLWNNDVSTASLVFVTKQMSRARQVEIASAPAYTIRKATDEIAGWLAEPRTGTRPYLTSGQCPMR
jgi:hypothetical protein